ncbi:hypothetical protein MASR2M36_36400 [Providencia sp.]
MRCTCNINAGVVSVLLGSAILGAVAGNVCKDVAQAMEKRFSALALTYHANDDYKTRHDTRFASFLRVCNADSKALTNHLNKEESHQLFSSDC